MVKKHRRAGGQGKKYLICAIVRGKKQICQLSESCDFVPSAAKCQEAAEHAVECLNEGSKSEQELIEAWDAVKQGEETLQEFLTFF